MPIPVAVPDATSVCQKHLGRLALPVAQLALLQVASDQPRQLSRGRLVLRENRIATSQVDPVAPAEPSASAKRERATRRAADGTPLHSFRTLLEDLANVTRNVCRATGPEGTRQSEFELDAQLSAERARALELLQGIRV